MPTIWGRLKGQQPERVDQCAKKDVAYTLREYRLAFGKDWTLWAGRKCDEPKAEATSADSRHLW